MIFLYSISVDALLFLIIWGIIFGQKIDEPYRLLVALVIFLSLSAKAFMLHYERRRHGRLIPPVKEPDDAQHR